MPSRSQRRNPSQPMLSLSSDGTTWVLSLCLGVVVFGILRTLERLTSFGIGIITGLNPNLSFADAWRESTRWVYVWFEWPGFSWIPCLLAGGTIGTVSCYIIAVLRPEWKHIWRRRLYWGAIIVWFVWSLRLLPVVIARLTRAQTYEDLLRTLFSISLYYALNILFTALAVWVILWSVEGIIALKRGGMMRRGFSLVEVLIVLLIIALLVALLVPVFLRARRYAQLAPCTSNLRQLHSAWAMYREDHDETWPRFLVDIRLYAKSREVFKCPLDAYNGIITQENRRGGFPVSYYLVPSVKWSLDLLSSVDKNHGVIACILHGEVKYPRYLVRGEGLFEPTAALDGLTLRVRLDGSVQRAQVHDERCYYDQDGTLQQAYCLWDLFTDVREGKERAQWCSEPEDPAAYVPCP